MSGLLKRLARIAIRRGMTRGNNGLLALGAIAGFLGWARSRAEAPPPVLHREVLRPGEQVCISVFDPPK